MKNWSGGERIVIKLLLTYTKKKSKGYRHPNTRTVNSDVSTSKLGRHHELMETRDEKITNGYKSKIVSYTVIFKAKKPIIRRRRIVEDQLPERKANCKENIDEGKIM